MKGIIAKLLNGESLTDDERSRATAFDLDKMMNEAAASARRKAEAERDAAREELAALKEQSSKGASDIDKLTKRLESLERAKNEAESKAKAMERSALIDSIRAKAGIKFIDGVNPDICNGAFAKCFDGVDDLGDETVVRDKVNGFIATNKGLILDDSGHGSGNKVIPSIKIPSINPWAKDTFNLTEQMRLSRESPQVAKTLQSEAQK